jgi:hypothetical protein
VRAPGEGHRDLHFLAGGFLLFERSLLSFEGFICVGVGPSN